MKRLVILGAGQMGKAARLLINESSYLLTAFGDNDGSGKIGGVPVLSVAQALLEGPDAVLIAVAGAKRADALESQVESLGYAGKVLRLDAFMETVDLRRAVVERLAERLKNIEGAVAELGVYRGEFARVLNRIFPERKLYLFDTFTGFDARDVKTEKARDFSGAKEANFSDTCAEEVLMSMPKPEMVVLRKGYFPETAQGMEEQFAFVSMDADLYEPTLAGLRWFWPRMVRGGVVLLHDYNSKRFSGVRQAADDFEAEHGKLAFVPLSDLHGSAALVKE